MREVARPRLDRCRWALRRPSRRLTLRACAGASASFACASARRGLVGSAQVLRSARAPGRHPDPRLGRRTGLAGAPHQRLSRCARRCAPPSTRSPRIRRAHEQVSRSLSAGASLTLDMRAYTVALDRQGTVLAGNFSNSSRWTQSILAAGEHRAGQCGSSACLFSATRSARRSTTSPATRRSADSSPPRQGDDRCHGGRRRGPGHRAQRGRRLPLLRSHLHDGFVHPVRRDAADRRRRLGRCEAELSAHRRPRPPDQPGELQ